ncbi:MAG TPA: hypothetical protein VIT91_12365 [Chthoniobacterales bacterium]
MNKSASVTQDFADWLSPMLVKELRQGMRSKVLTTSLFLLQGLLICNVIAGFGSGGSEVNLRVTNGFFWSILALPLLLILPGSALGSLGNEIKANTLELIFLTRLTSRRIVLGKWIAVMAQAALLAVTVLPYVALRYYMGGVNVTRDLLTVGLMLGLSAMLTAITVALSAFQSKLLRVFIIIGFILLLQSGFYIAALLAFDSGGFAVGGTGRADGLLFLGQFAMALLLIGLMLEVGAARIAPEAENHAGPLRLLVLLLVLVGGFTAMRAPDARWLLILAEAVAGLFCLGALSENIPGVKSLYGPFTRRGVPGKAAALVFTPGWVPGVFFTLLVIGLLGLFWQGAGWLRFGANEQDQLRLASFLGFSATLLLPAALISVRFRKRGFFYIGFTAICAGVFFFLTMLTNTQGNSHLYQFGAFLPPIAIFSIGFEELDEMLPVVLLWLFALNVLALVLLAWKCRAPLRDLRARLENRMKKDQPQIFADENRGYSNKSA